ncbi:MAG: SGNH/GDSL hydrolase family protein [Acetobacteraceae bacterium]
MADDRHWVGTWTATPAPADGVALSAPTIRMFPRISIGGDTIRVRISNAHGTDKLAIGAAHVALRAAGGGTAIRPDTDRVLTFGGSPSAVIPTGAFLVSDPVSLTVPPLADLAVSIHLPADIPASFGVTGRYSRQTNYLSPPGNFAAEEMIPASRITDDWYFLSGIDVLAGRDVGGIVAMGDSLTDGNISTHDAFCRWPDQLARRLVARGGRQFGVMNQGLGGNRILHDIRGYSGVRRFDRDVLAMPGVTHAIVVLGINDIRNRRGLASEVVTAEGMIAGLHQMALRAKARGIRLFAGTLTPFENETFLMGAYTLEGEAKRQAVNEWIRTSGAFDAVIDFDLALRDPSHPARMLPVYDCGDHLHPGDIGYNRMGDVIDLSLFD